MPLCGAITTSDVSPLTASVGYLVLGACNPTLAHRALSIDSQVGYCCPATSSLGVRRQRNCLDSRSACDVRVSGNPALVPL